MTLYLEKRIVFGIGRSKKMIIVEVRLRRFKVLVWKKITAEIRTYWVKQAVNFKSAVRLRCLGQLW